jgi:hypothetical protein
MTESQKQTMDPVHLLSVGPFGEAVARYFLQLRSDVTTTTIPCGAKPEPNLWPKARVHLIASWRPVAALCRYLDDLAFQNKLPVVPLILDSSLLQLGPVVVPESGCCWHCWELRTMQHGAVPSARSALWEFYDNHDTAGPEGYLEPFAAIGASRLSLTVDALDCRRVAPGQVWQMNLLSRGCQTSFEVGVDGCPRCGSGRSLATRSVEELKRHVGYLWTNDAGN